MTLNKIASNANELSIKKWQNIADGNGIDMGVSNCALCKEFFYAKYDGTRCGGCPVKARTGKTACRNTPYVEWCGHHVAEHEGDVDMVDTKVICPECKEIALREVAFLKSLRDEPVAPVDWTKPLRFRGSTQHRKRAVRFICNDLVACCPVVVAVLQGDNETLDQRCTDGSTNGTPGGPWDIINYPDA